MVENDHYPTHGAYSLRGDNAPVILPSTGYLMLLDENRYALLDEDSVPLVEDSG